MLKPEQKDNNCSLYEYVNLKDLTTKYIRRKYSQKEGKNKDGVCKN